MLRYYLKSRNPKSKQKFRDVEPEDKKAHGQGRNFAVLWYSVITES